MLNVIALSGKVVTLPVIKETANGIKFASIVLAVTRPFPNSNSTYDIDHISVTLWKGVAEMAMEICEINDLLAIKGRVQSYQVEKGEQTFYNYEIVAEHVTYFKLEQN